MGTKRLLLLCGLLLGGCKAPVEDVDPFTRYLGAASPIDSDEVDGTTTHTFSEDDGPMCFRQKPFRMVTRPGATDDLVIFLQGGGACWSDFCLAIDSAPPGIPLLEILNPELENNPVKDWDVAYVPYCDASLFAGDIDVDEDGDGSPDRFHRGLQNISAAVDQASRDFPSPSRIMLAGSSGGGYGTIVASQVVRARYPDAPIYIVQDSGLGIGKGMEDPEFIWELVDEFNARALIEATCGDCLDSGHLTPMVHWILENDSNVWVSAFSTYSDLIIADIFLQVGATAYRAALLEQSELIRADFPDRWMPFYLEGVFHTTLLGSVEGILGELPEEGSVLEGVVELGSMETTELEGVLFTDWMMGMLNGDAIWQPMVE